MRPALRCIAPAVFLVTAAACGRGPTGPSQPDAPVILCPGSVAVSGQGGSQSVSFPAPTTTGGALPVSVTCAPASGAVFSVGATAVACTATDSIGRRAQCGFSVTLSAPLLSVTKFVAFGDSVTEGENGRAAVLGMGFVDLSNTYPARLTSLLNAEYPGQGITVSNQGVSGESVHTASRRLPGVLADERAGAVLLLDGYNDLLNGCHAPNAGTALCRTAVDEVISKMRECIRIAKTPAYGVHYIFVSTLTPPGPYGSGSDRRIASEAIVRTNARLSEMVRGEGAILVDPYPLFIGHESEYVEADGLHPRPAGYQVLAETFFAAIKSSVAATPQLGARP